MHEQNLSMLDRLSRRSVPNTRIQPTFDVSNSTPSSVGESDLVKQDGSVAGSSSTGFTSTIRMRFRRQSDDELSLDRLDKCIDLLERTIEMLSQEATSDSDDGQFIPPIMNVDGPTTIHVLVFRKQSAITT